LAPDFGGTEAGIQPRGAELGVSLALAVDNGGDIGKQIGEVVFGTLAAARSEVVRDGDAAFEFARSFTNDDAAPAKIPFRLPLPPGPSSLTVRAMKTRRALPLRVLAVSIKSALSESVNSILVPPANDVASVPPRRDGLVFASPLY
jgi:hypothetical protein